MDLTEAVGCGPVPVQLAQEGEFPRPHPDRLVGFGVVVAEHVQDAVHEQEGQFVLQGAGVAGGLFASDLGQITTSPSISGMSPGSSGARSGPRLCAEGLAITSTTSPPSIGNDNTSVGPDLPR